MQVKDQSVEIVKGVKKYEKSSILYDFAHILALITKSNYARLGGNCFIYFLGIAVKPTNCMIM